ncbi:His-Xaa-Ser repeat protein HxsA [Pseudomonas siliginis]|uniref:His-Xaa-Ser repeat protein HxsA n=1 Tax=Pseudomonas siliginis TaxID=2842346 RepID=UPI002092A50E|nr:His-Xaa-Ser repeat protein HxsA [Pseudomonas siliginis]UST92737.1 His-Xaa-Ser repeat protein HxsA [Pseudomonas siliginis]
MKLLDRWKLLIGQSIAIMPMIGSPMADANQAQLASADWLPNPNSAPPAFKNTLNAKDAINIYAAHRSHSSHSSHSSHYSGSSGYSAPRTYTAPNTSYYTPPASTGSTYRSATSSPSTTTTTPGTGSTTRSNAYAATPAKPAANDLAMLVRRVQLALMIKSYYSGPIDGVLGNSTRGSLMAFQADSGISSSGKMDTPTLNALGIAIP